ncbi:MAG: FAD/NAD(P)-binding protein [Myxococcota bacterium]
MEELAESVPAAPVKSLDTEWLIVGAGLHGAHFAIRLLARGVAASDILLLDPKPIFHRWRTRTSRLQMSHLRSPSVHHIGVAPFDLEQFAGKRRRRSRGFRGPYSRPTLSLFDAHCDRVAHEYALHEMLFRGRATRCEVASSHLVVHCACGTSLRTKNIVLALGVTEPARPETLPPESCEHARHVFDERSIELPKRSTETVVVVGGGVTGAQLALALVACGNRVELFSRHALRVAAFDSDPCWIGPSCMEGFQRERCPNARRTLINEARNRGTMPADVKRALVRAREQGSIEIRAGRPIVATDLDRREHVFLATGFSPKRPGGPLVDHLIHKGGLPVAPCGYPLVDAQLRWHPRVFVTGALAELELGPAARNITGARHAAERIVETTQ